jgi:hypothetical protein
MGTNKSSELLRCNHAAIDGLSLDVRSTSEVRDRRAGFREFSAVVAIHSGCLRSLVMPALASSRHSEARSLVLESLAAVDSTLLAVADMAVASGEFNAGFNELDGLLQILFEQEARLLFPLLGASPENIWGPLAQRIEIYGARCASEATRDARWFRHGLR